MERAELIAALEAHAPADAKETADREAMLRYARQLADPFSAEQPGAHFTASGVLVDGSGKRVCLVHHRKLDRWLQPGGHVEASDVSLVEAARREVREETGLDAVAAGNVPLDLDVHEIPARLDRAAHLHLDVRFLFRAAGETVTVSDESHDVRWFDLGEAIAASEGELRRLLEKARAASA